eukprot:6184906-Pleurochrysis_carterae.AAC.2
MAPRLEELPVAGASVTHFDRYGDSRGYFNELFNADKYDERLPRDWKQVVAPHLLQHHDAGPALWVH